MNNSLLADSSPFGWHVADSPEGPVPLVRLGDLPGALAAKRRLSLTAAALAVCDRLAQVDYAGVAGIREAFPEVSTSAEFESLRPALDGLQLYRLRAGMARQIFRADRPLPSESWRPGDPIPKGYELRPGPRPSPWDAFRPPEVSLENAQHIAWVYPGEERRPGSPHTWITELCLSEHWEHLIEGYGAVDVDELTYCRNLDPLTEPDESHLSYLAMRRDVAVALWPDLFDAASNKAKGQGGPVLHLHPAPTTEQRRQAMAAAVARCGPPMGFVIGRAWTDEMHLAFRNAYAALRNAGHKKDDALDALARAGWAHAKATLAKRITAAKDAAERKKAAA